MDSTHREKAIQDPKKQVQRTRCGMTLMEVLMVTAIVGVLLGALLLVLRPTLMAKAYDTEAIAGLRGWYNAYQMYRADHEDKEPPRDYPIFAYNPGAEWNVPKQKRNYECAGSGYFYSRMYAAQVFEKRPGMLNPYDPEKEPIFKASHRCRRPTGVIHYYVYGGKNDEKIRQSVPNQQTLCVFANGNVKLGLKFTPFEAEMALMMGREGVPR